MARLEPDRGAVPGVRAELAQHPFRPLRAAVADLPVREQRHRPVDPDRQHVVVVGNPRLSPAATASFGRT